MCGICGIFSAKRSQIDRNSLLSMRAELSHRGPDDEGEYFQNGIGLGFRRLSILDLDHGHQPMVSPDGSAAVVFNGEIYNHPQLKAGLEAGGARYLTRSDTETILHLYRKEGISFLKHLSGMFALALWDCAKSELILARDPMGIKPLYYAVRGDELLFSSELRSLLAGGVSPRLDDAGVWDYLEYGCAHAPSTVIKGVFKLPPGHFLRVNFSDKCLPRDCGFHFERFALLEASELSISEDEALVRLEYLFEQSVKAHCLSDVPVGAFLSGGVDSSLVAAAMRKYVSGKVKTFSIGFSGGKRGLDESGCARRVADYLGTEHQELILPAGVLREIDECLLCLDEPLGDSAVLPTYLLSRFARKSVKVVLTGEGADELFAGYGRYKAAYLTHLLKRVPSPLMPAASAAARLAGKGEFFRRIPVASSLEWARASAHSSAAGIESLCSCDYLERLKKFRRRSWLGYLEKTEGFNGILIYDMRAVLAESLLMKVDKATMRASLEARVPFLGSEIAAFALSLPPELKIRCFKSKWILRKLAEKYVPKSVASRAKHGFWVPWEEWIRAENARVDSAVASDSLRDEGILDTAAVASAISGLRKGERGGDAGLLYRAAVLALWFEDIRRH